MKGKKESESVGVIAFEYSHNVSFIVDERIYFKTRQFFPLVLVYYDNKTSTFDTKSNR
jgi:hypothetical protein